MKKVIYHKNCQDGFGAALCAWLLFGDEAEYHAAAYGDPLPSIPDGAEVYILDFSFPRIDLIRLAQRVRKLVVLDHHETARQELDGGHVWDVQNCELEIRFDMKKSGAMLAWEYFFPNGEAPPLIRYIQDRDLWQWKLPHSKEFSAGLHLEHRDFARWKKLIEMPPMELIQKGVVALQSTHRFVSAIAQHAALIQIDEFSVIAVNTSILQSEVCSELLVRWPDADFAAAWYRNAAGGLVFSLRSQPWFDVSAVAKRFGGGGHHCAAGFTLQQMRSTAFIAPNLAKIESTKLTVEAE